MMAMHGAPINVLFLCLCGVVIFFMTIGVVCLAVELLGFINLVTKSILGLFLHRLFAVTVNLIRCIITLCAILLAKVLVADAMHAFAVVASS